MAYFFHFRDESTLVRHKRQWFELYSKHFGIKTGVISWKYIFKTKNENILDVQLVLLQCILKHCNMTTHDSWLNWTSNRWIQPRESQMFNGLFSNNGGWQSLWITKKMSTMVLQHTKKTRRINHVQKFKERSFNSLM